MLLKTLLAALSNGVSAPKVFVVSSHEKSLVRRNRMAGREARFGDARIALTSDLERTWLQTDYKVPEEQFLRDPLYSPFIDWIHSTFLLSV